MYAQILIVAAAATAISVFTYLIALLCVRSYAKGAAQLPADDKQRKTALSNLQATLNTSVRWGTVMCILYILLAVVLWFFGAPEQQAIIIKHVGIWGCSVLLAALVCHFFCTACLSSMGGASEQPQFLSIGRKLILRMVIVSILAIALYLFVAY